MKEWRLAQPVDFELCNGEHIAIVGNNGSGKTKLADMISGAHPLLQNQPHYDFLPSSRPYAADNIKKISFEDAYGTSVSNYYLQKRWNMHDIEEDTPTVKDILDKADALTNDKHNGHEEFKRHLYDIFAIRPMLDKLVISLSSGEIRKLQLTKNLLTQPRVLIMDNPFIGLDNETRTALNYVFRKLATEFPIQIILVMPDNYEIPDFITHIIETKNLVASHKIEKDAYLKKCKLQYTTQEVLDSETAETIKKSIATIPYTHREENISDIIKMCNVTIRYGNKTILKEFCWIVKRGENWAVNGKNGAGKSTLLSLVCADNPQRYACDIRLFGKQRGHGESIWEIKRRIGYVSPELHRAYRQDISVLHIVASGLKDSVGLYVKTTEEENTKCERWLKIFGIDHLKDRRFHSLSSGEQRVVLLARAFVKDPQLLILDEPFHGLDRKQRNKAKYIINEFSKRKDKTIIMVSHYNEDYPPCINRELTLEKTNF